MATNWRPVPNTLRIRRVEFFGVSAEDKQAQFQEARIPRGSVHSNDLIWLSGSEYCLTVSREISKVQIYVCAVLCHVSSNLFKSLGNRWFRLSTLRCSRCRSRCRVRCRRRFLLMPSGLLRSRGGRLSLMARWRRGGHHRRRARWRRRGHRRRSRRSSRRFVLSLLPIPMPSFLHPISGHNRRRSRWNRRSSSNRSRSSRKCSRRPILSCRRRGYNRR